jgi:hypothetical protein
MISAKRIHEEYKRHLNRVNADYDTRIGTIDADGFINESIDIVFENLAAKFETNTLVRNHLRQLEVKNYKPEVFKLDKDSSYIKYPENFYMLTRQTLKACKENCSEDRVIDLYMIQSSDLSQSLKDPNWKPSWEWEQALVDDTGDSLIIYHNCEFDPKEVTIDYLKKPNHIATPSMMKNGTKYISSETGQVLTSDINLELDSTFFWRKVVQVAVLNTQLSLGDFQDYQAQLNNILNLDKIFIN